MRLKNGSTLRLCGALLIACAISAFMFGFWSNLSKIPTTDYLIDLVLLDVVILCSGCFLFVSPYLLKRKMMLPVALFLVSLAGAILIIEAVSMVLVTSRSHTSTQIVPTQLYYQRDTVLGYRGIPNSSTVVELKNGSASISNVTYTLGNAGWRICDAGHSARKIVLFGDSMVFGDGLQDHETLCAQLSEHTDDEVLNYGFTGYGTQQMLALFESDSFYTEVNSTDASAIYVFIAPHIRRVIGDMYSYNQWAFDFPYYRIDGTTVSRHGSFSTGRPFLSVFYRLLDKSWAVKLLGINLPVPDKSDVNLTYRVIEKSRNIFKTRFNGTFLVVAHPATCGDEDTEALIAMLQRNGIIAQKLCVGNYRDNTIQGNPHPNAQLNGWLAYMLAEDLASPDRNISQK